MRYRIVALLLTLISTVFLTSEVASESDNVEIVSLYALVSNPKAFDGKLIRVGGYWLTGEEQSILCPQRMVAWPRDCVWLSPVSGGDVDWSRAGKPTRAQGRFVATTGDRGMIVAGMINAVEIARAIELKHDGPNRMGGEPRPTESNEKSN